MKKILLILLGLCCFIFSGCSYNSLQITYDDITTLNIGETYLLPHEINNQDVDWVSDSEVVSIDDYHVIAVTQGTANLFAYADNKIIDKKIVVVYERVTNIIIEGDSNIIIGEKTQLKAILNPVEINQNVIWESSDSDIATIDQNGVVKALSEGLTVITATSKVDSQAQSSKLVHVIREGEIYEDEIIFEYLQENLRIDSNHFNNLLAPLIENVSGFVIGVSNYVTPRVKIVGGGIIYKRNIYLKNGEKTDVVDNFENLDTFEYWVVTNRHIINNHDYLKIYYQDNKDEIPAELIEYDDKEDLAVLKFYSKIYFPIAEFTDEVETGDFVLAIGHPVDYTYFRSATLGIISHPQRYVSVDTDNDEVNDWDALYIQHDAPITEGSTGGPLVNLQGKVVGINTAKHGGLDSNIDKMGFAIPTPLVQKIVRQLEQGIRPQRALLGVTVMSVKTILRNPSLFPDIMIPAGLDYGFYINEVNEGIAKEAGVLPGDILIKFNQKPIRYSYELRAEINNFILGSGEIVEIVVIRNQEEKKLYLIY